MRNPDPEPPLTPTTPPFKQGIFPKMELTGGPLGRGTELKINGERVPKVTRMELVADVNDVIRITTTQIVVAFVDVEGMWVPTEKVKAAVRLHRPEGVSDYAGEGETLREALDVALEKAEKAEEPRAE